MVSAVDGLLLGQMRKHLDAKAAVEVIRDPLFPRAPYDLRGQAARDARLGHDVVGNLPGATEELVPRHHLVHHSVLKSLFSADALARQQSVGATLHTHHLQEAAVKPIPGDGPKVDSRIE